MLLQRLKIQHRSFLTLHPWQQKQTPAHSYWDLGTKKDRFPSVTEDDPAVVGPMGKRMMASKVKCEIWSYSRTVLGEPLIEDPRKPVKERKAYYHNILKTGDFFLSNIPPIWVLCQLLPWLSHKNCSKDIAKPLLWQKPLNESVWELTRIQGPLDTTIWLDGPCTLRHTGCLILTDFRDILNSIR